MAERKTGNTLYEQLQQDYALMCDRWGLDRNFMDGISFRPTPKTDLGILKSIRSESPLKELSD